MDNLELQRLRDLPIEGVAERLGLHVVRHKALCPFHDDHHASLSFSPSRNTYRCFACGAHGSTIDLAMHLLSKGFIDTCRWLADEHNVIITNHKAPPLGEVGRGLTPTFDAARYARYFEHPYLSPAAHDFLYVQRHLDPRVIRWCRITSWRDRNSTNWLQIPYFNTRGALIGIQNRNLDYPLSPPPSKPSCEPPSAPSCEVPSAPSCEVPLSPPWEGPGEAPFPPPLEKPCPAPRFRFPRGSHCTIYNLPVLALLQPSEPLYITEGASDCWAMLSSGHKAIAIPSATLLNPADIALLQSLVTTHATTFHMYPDRDLPGERLFLQLRTHLPNLIHHPLPPSCKDYSDYYLLTH